jgi:hypothetical protein
MTNYELAVALARLGAVNAMSLGTGDAAMMAFDGTLLTRPSGAKEQAGADALLLSYTGVYAAPPHVDVVSPNGDGSDDTQTFDYRLVRASTITATLVAPDRSTRVLVQDGEQPGLHTLTWDGRTAWRARPSGSSRSTTRSARCRRRRRSPSSGRRHEAPWRRPSTWPMLRG